MKPPDPRAILEAAGLGAKKSWGQNFLLDQNVLESIAAATECGPACTVLELGAGLGALTYHLLERGARVVAVERDRQIVPLLRAALGASRHLEIDETDAARIDYEASARRLGGPLTIAGNLPYQIASRIIVSVADASAVVRRAVFLIQREVGERLAASPGGKTFGLLSVLAQRNLDVELLRRVPPSAFLPRPKVTSVVVRLTPHGRALSPADDRRLVATARAAFSSRRKVLRNAVAAGLGADRGAVEAAIVQSGIDPGLRGEQLSVEELARVAGALASAGLLA